MNITIINLLMSILAIWITVVIVGTFYTSWKMTPLNKYRGRTAGQLCVIISQSILLSLIWISTFGYKISGTYVLMFWSFSLIFFLLWFLGFSEVERRDIKKLIRKAGLERIRWKGQNDNKI